VNNRRRHMRRNRRTCEPAQVTYFNISRPGLTLQTADLLQYKKADDRNGEAVRGQETRFL
jgi:hypothetical protein